MTQPKPLLKQSSQSSLAQDFLKTPKDFWSGLARTRFTDMNHLHAAQMAYDHIARTVSKERAEFLIGGELAGLMSVGGIGNSLASMTESNVYVTEGAGIQVSKEAARDIRQLAKAKQINRNNDRNNDDRRDDG